MVKPKVTIRNIGLKSNKPVKAPIRSMVLLIKDLYIFSINYSAIK